MNRLRLIQWLNNMSPSAHNEFIELVTIAGLPPGNLCSASQATKNHSALEWWESPLGPKDLTGIVLLSNMAVLFSALYAIPGSQFGQLLFAMDAPRGEMLGETAPQKDRSKVFVKWVFKNGLTNELVDCLRNVGVVLYLFSYD